MDNIVQNINIADIIPYDFQPNLEEKQKIDELVIYIKQFGLLDPVLLRKHEDKYELIAGMDKYQAAVIAKQNIIPAIIQETNNEQYTQNSNEINQFNNTINSSQTATFYQETNNSDIINLSELNKNKLEYERDDVKMNNQQQNNNLNPQNMNSEIPTPTFGGRFFPSLEDEPTNMNMMGNFNNASVMPTPEVSLPTPNNNLIDLTDLNNEKEINPLQNQNLEVPTMPITTGEVQMNNLMSDTMENTTFNPIGNNAMDLPMQELNSPSNNTNIINLESLQNNNPAVKPVSMDILNEDFGSPKTMMQPEFVHSPISEVPTRVEEVPQAIVNPIPSIGASIPQPEFVNSPISEVPTRVEEVPQAVVNPIPSIGASITQPEFVHSPISEVPTRVEEVPQAVVNPIPGIGASIPQPEFVHSPISEVPTRVEEVPQVVVTPTPNLDIDNAMSKSIITPKDVTPVNNTIKNLVNNLKEFGYNINITTEDLPTVSKLTIEIEK